MNEIDLKIIRELTKNAQTPFLRIAKKLSVSPETVRRRYAEMRKEGTIIRSTISIDLSKIGYQGKAFLMITNSPNQDKTTTIEALKKIRNVFLIAETIGDFDAIAIAPVKDLKSIIALVNEIKNLPSVISVEIAFVDDTAFPVADSYGKLFL